MKYLIAFLLLGLTINLEAKQKPRAIKTVENVQVQSPVGTVP